MTTRSPNTPREKGMATVLVMALVGMAVTATTLGTVYTIRSTQDSHLAVHANTGSEALAWAGIELTRQYLIKQQEDGETPEEGRLFESSDGALLVEAVTVTEDQITTRITGTATAAKTVLEAVYSWSSGSAGSTATDNSVVSFYDGLIITNGIEVLTDNGQKLDIDVMGDVTISSTGITGNGISTIKSTGSISYSAGASTFEKLHASCDIKLSNAENFYTGIAQTTRNICIENIGGLGIATANGSISLSGGNTTTYQLIQALANTPTGAASCKTGQTLCTKLNQNLGIEFGRGPNALEAKTKGSVKIASATVQKLRADLNLDVTECTPQLTDVLIGGSYKPMNCQGLTQAVPTSTEKVAIDQIPEVSMQAEAFDVTQYKPAANYIFTYHNGIRVQVRNVEGIADSDSSSNSADIRQHGYFLLAKNKDSHNWLCRTATANDANCIAPLARFDDQESWNGEVIKYSNGTWKLGESASPKTSIAPGVAYFTGNLEMLAGTYYGTFIAEGDITAGTSLNIFAPNYAGKSGGTTTTNKENKPENLTYYGMCNNTKYQFKPKNFCSGDSFNNNTPTGNYALMAGKCGDDLCSSASYIGGNITTRTNADIFGSIKAGNIFNSEWGLSIIHGYITAYAQKTNNPTTHTLGSKTVIDLRNLPEGYNPAGGSTNFEQDSSEASEIKLLWTRYL